MTSPTQSPGMSELRGLLEKATKGDWAAWSIGQGQSVVRSKWMEGDTRLTAYIAVCQSAGQANHDNATLIAAMYHALPTLLDDLAAAQGEVEALRAAISWLMPPFVDSKTPTEELRTRVKVMLDDVARLDARSALTLKSEDGPL